MGLRKKQKKNPLKKMFLNASGDQICGSIKKKQQEKSPKLSQKVPNRILQVGEISFHLFIVILPHKRSAMEFDGFSAMVFIQ